jgi:hypothetical protein
VALYHKTPLMSVYYSILNSMVDSHPPHMGNMAANSVNVFPPVAKIGPLLVNT